LTLGNPEQQLAFDSQLRLSGLHEVVLEQRRIARAHANLPNASKLCAMLARN
jgi:hypothetical protein